MRFPRAPRPRSLAGQLFAMQAVLVAVVVAGCALFTYVSDRSQAEDAAGRQAMGVARSVADSPSVRQAIRTADPTRTLQPYALAVQRGAQVDFVTIMDPEGIRWTHPNEELIGKHFLGHTDRALLGESFTETYTGTLGESVRAVTPIRDGGRIVGLVSAGIKVDEISQRVEGQVKALIGVAAAALALGAVGTYVINARLRRSTHGMNAAELSRMHDYHEATLHAVREGLLMLDGQYRVALINDGGRELLGVGGDVVGRSVAELELPAPLTGALLSGEPRVDEVYLTASRVLVVNTSPVSGGERRGTVVTLRDVTELQSLMGELDSERGFTTALRSQAHEAANRLHTVVSLIELGRAEEAVDFATAELELAQALTDQVVAAVSEPVLAALLLGKTAQANERGVELVVSEDSSIDDGLFPESLTARDLVTVLGNLIDNAVDAAQGSVGARVTVTALADAAGLVLRVSDTGEGVDPAHTEEVFRRGWSTKPAGPGGRGLGLALVRQAVARHDGTLTMTTAPGAGASFEVRLPLPPTTGTTTTTPADPEPGSASAARPESGTASAAAPDSGTASETRPGSGAASETGPNSGTDSETGPNSGTERAAAHEPRSRTGPTRPTAEPQPAPGSGSATGPEAGAEHTPTHEPRSGPAPGPEAGPGPGPGPARTPEPPHAPEPPRTPEPAPALGLVGGAASDPGTVGPDGTGGESRAGPGGGARSGGGAARTSETAPQYGGTP